MTKPLHDSSPRLATLDALRGLAALLVVLFHIFTAPQAGEARRVAVLFSVVDLGHLGVCLFFIISGYVIPLSLDRSPLRVFWWRRFVRLYPCYWLSIVLVLIMSVTGRAQPFSEQFQRMPAWLTLVNLTMLQSLFGGDHLLGVYWSLFYELVFYGVMSLLVILGLGKRSVWIALVVWTLAVLNDGVVGHFGGGVPLVISLFGLMAIGHVLYRVAEQRADGRWGYLLAILFCLLFSALPAPLETTLARCGAVVVFMALMHIQWQPRLMVWLGLMSYPLYLTHELVIATIETQNSALNVLLWIAGSVLFASMLYWDFEQPILRLGRRL